MGFLQKKDRGWINWNKIGRATKKWNSEPFDRKAPPKRKKEPHFCGSLILDNLNNFITKVNFNIAQNITQVIGDVIA